MSYIWSSYFYLFLIVLADFIKPHVWVTQHWDAHLEYKLPYKNPMTHTDKTGRQFSQSVCLLKAHLLTGWPVTNPGYHLFNYPIVSSRINRCWDDDKDRWNYQSDNPHGRVSTEMRGVATFNYSYSFTSFFWFTALLRKPS